MCMYMYVYVYVCMFVYICIYESVYFCVYMYVCMYVRRNKSAKPQIILCIMYRVLCSNQARLNKRTGSAEEDELWRGV